MKPLFEGRTLMIKGEAEKQRRDESVDYGIKTSTEKATQFPEGYKGLGF